MPDDPDKRKQLDRLARRERLKTLAVPLGIGTVILAVAAFAYMPREQLGVVEATLIRFVATPSDDAVQTRLLLAMPDGSNIRLRQAPGEAVLAPGDTICLQRSRHPVTGRLRHMRVPNARCQDAESDAAQ